MFKLTSGDEILTLENIESMKVKFLFQYQLTLRMLDSIVSG